MGELRQGRSTDFFDGEIRHVVQVYWGFPIHDDRNSIGRKVGLPFFSAILLYRVEWKFRGTDALILEDILDDIDKQIEKEHLANERNAELNSNFDYKG